MCADERRIEALVTDVHHRSAVAGLRGLGRAGIPALGLAPHPLAGGLWSRFAAGRAIGPSAADPGYLARIDELAQRRGPLVVYPGTEESLTTLLRRPDALGPAVTLPLATGEPSERVRDKRRLLELAAEAGFESPATFAQAAAGALRGERIPTPCIVKSASSKGALDPPVRAADPEQLEAVLAGVPDDEPLLVQEAAPGPLTAMAVVVARDGTLVARHQQTARRLWPPTAGGSSVAVSVAPDEELARRIARMLASAGYWGLAHVQFMSSARGPLLIDVNVRFYGSMPLALACGVNLPAAWHAVATGGPLPSPAPYRVGVAYRRLEADVFAAAHGNFRQLLHRTPPPRAGAMWDREDPLPGVLMGAEVLSTRLWGRIRQTTPR